MDLSSLEIEGPSICYRNRMLNNKKPRHVKMYVWFLIQSIVYPFARLILQMLNTSHSVSVKTFREKYKIPVTVPRVTLEMHRGLQRKTTGKCDPKCVVKLATVRKPDWSVGLSWKVSKGHEESSSQRNRYGRKEQSWFRDLEGSQSCWRTE